MPLFMKNVLQFRDDGGNLLLILLSKTDHGGSMIFQFGDCAGQGRC